MYYIFTFLGTGKCPALLFGLIQFIIFYKHCSSQDLDEDGGIPKIEAQVWLAIYSLLSKKVFTDKYEINTYRKNVIGKMAEYISDDYMDQLPMLKSFKKWLLQLSISNPPSSSSHMKANFMIETVAELREGLIRR